MRGFERGFVVYAIVYMAIYVPLFFGTAYASMSMNPEPWGWWFFRVLLPLHFLGMAQNFAALALTLRDLYLRPFPGENDKLLWCVLILGTGGIGWLMYLWMYAFKPRAPIGSTDSR